MHFFIYPEMFGLVWASAIPVHCSSQEHFSFFLCFAYYYSKMLTKLALQHWWKLNASWLCPVSQYRYPFVENIKEKKYTMTSKVKSLSAVWRARGGWWLFPTAVHKSMRSAAQPLCSLCIFRLTQNTTIWFPLVNPRCSECKRDDSEEPRPFHCGEVSSSEVQRRDGSPQ